MRAVYRKARELLNAVVWGLAEGYVKQIAAAAAKTSALKTRKEIELSTYSGQRNYSE